MKKTKTVAKSSRGKKSAVGIDHLRSEGDINISPARAEWAEGHLSRKTKEILKEDARYFLHQSLSSPCLNVLQSCGGAWIEDVEGRRLLDFHGNNVHQTGFGHPKIVSAITKQMAEMSFCTRRYTNIPAINLAKKLTELAPGDLNRVLFAPGGTSEIGMALKLARAATGRFKTVSLWDSFHGASLDAISIGGEAIFRQNAGPLLPGCEHAPPADPRHCPFRCGSKCNLNCADYIEYVLAKEGDVAAVIAETVRSTPFIPPVDYWKRIRRACDKHGALLILDEVPHCLGRTGKMFTCEHYGIVPDILVIGKALGGGIFPLAAMIAREGLNVAGEKALGHYTHEKNPVACAAALAAIEVIEEERLMDRARELGDRSLQRMGEMRSRLGIIGDTRGLGLLMGMELVRNRDTNERAIEEAERVMYSCLSKGLNFKVTMGNILTLTPALTISEDELDLAFKILEEAIGEVATGSRLAILGVLFLLHSGMLAAPFTRPNFIFLLSDDQRRDTIHALGNDVISTPNLDKLAHSGMTFRRAYCMGGMQGAVCVPSRAMIMTGRSLFRCTTEPAAGTILPGVETWPEYFRRAGYETIGIGKWHNDKAAYVRSFSSGGPIFFGGMSDPWNIPVFDFDRTGAYPKQNEHKTNIYSTELFAESAAQFLKQQSPTRPFMLYVAFTTPHDPRTPPKPFLEMYPPENIPLPKNFLPKHPFDNGEMTIRDEALLPWPRDSAAVRKEIAAYYGMISHLDEQVGKILDALEATGEAKNTYIIFASDHGLAIGSHGLLGKQNLYEESMGAPLILTGPGIPPNRTTDALCYLYDLFPTACDLAGLPIPSTVEGKSLAGPLSGHSETGRDSIFCVYRDVQRSIRDKQWKLIYYPKIQKFQLFDLSTDPDEMKNLATEPHLQKRLLELKRKLAAAERLAGDPAVRRQ